MCVRWTSQFMSQKCALSNIWKGYKANRYAKKFGNFLEEKYGS